MYYQKKTDKTSQYIIAQIDLANGLQALDALKNLAQSASTCHETEENLHEYAVDDNTGVFLDPNAVRKARAEEIEYVREMNLYTKVPIKECLEKTGKQPIAVRWIDVNKGDEKNPIHRSRLVGKEFNTYLSLIHI